MTDKKTELVPFHAINEFMRPDFRMTVVRSALLALPNLPEDHRKAIEQETKKHVKIHGFRNADKAPAAAKAGPIANAFEKHPELVAAVLAAWAEDHADLRQQVYDFLKGRGWWLLPLEMHRDKLPGFFIFWPKAEEFELLNKVFNETYPDNLADSDTVSLMMVWVSMRLPYQLVDDTPEAVTRLLDIDLEQYMPKKETDEPAEPKPESSEQA